MKIGILGEDDEIEIFPSLIRVVDYNNDNNNGIRYYAITTDYETVEVDLYDVNDDGVVVELDDVDNMEEFDGNENSTIMLLADADTFNRYTFIDGTYDISNVSENETYYYSDVLEFVKGKSTDMLWSTFTLTMS